MRLIGVDTPEMVQQNSQVDHFVKEATDYTRNYLQGKSVTLEFDPAQRTDIFGRMLAYIRLFDGTDFNLKLIHEGYAHAYLKFPHPRLEEYRAAELYARINNKGLWADEDKFTKSSETYWLNTGSNTLHNSSCRWYGNTKTGFYTKEPTGRDCRICGGAHHHEAIRKPADKPSTDDIIVYVTHTGSKFHRAGCRYLKKSSIPMKLSEAKRSYSPCSVCNPPK